MISRAIHLCLARDLPSCADSLAPSVPIRARLLRHLLSVRRLYWRVTAGWSVAHILAVPIVSVDRDAAVRLKRGSTVPARVALHPHRGWEGA